MPISIQQLVFNIGSLKYFISVKFNNFGLLNGKMMSKIGFPIILKTSSRLTDWDDQLTDDLLKSSILSRYQCIVFFSSLRLLYSCTPAYPPSTTRNSTLSYRITAWNTMTTSLNAQLADKPGAWSLQSYRLDSVG